MSNLRKMFRWGSLGVLGSLAFLLTSCDLNDDDNNVQPIPVSYVSIYNAVPNAPDLDLTVDSRLVNSRPFEFGDNTYYLNFYTGGRKFQISPYGANNVVVDTTLTLVDGNAYSVFFVDEFNKAKILVTNDSAALSNPEKVKVRLINLSPDASPVTLKVKDDTIALTEGQAFKKASGFVELDPKTYSFEITSAGGEQPIVIPNVELEAGEVRTIVVRGYRTPPAGNTNVISAEIIRN